MLVECVLIRKKKRTLIKILVVYVNIENINSNIMCMMEKILKRLRMTLWLLRVIRTFYC
jgi:hypothetical protein